MKMMYKIFFAVLFSVVLVFADLPERYKNLTFANTTLKFEMLSDDAVKITDELGQSWMRSLVRKEFDKSLAPKVIIFDMFVFDPSLVDHRLKYFASVPVGNGMGSPLIADTDQDSLMELIGAYKAFDMNIPNYNRIFEQASKRSNLYVQVCEQLGGLYHAREFEAIKLLLVK